MSDWQPIDTAERDGRVISIRWRLVGERRWHKARASYRTERKPALFEPLTGKCFAEARDLSGWMYEDRPYLVPGIVEWHS
jgi:hypothetical protein